MLDGVILCKNRLAMSITDIIPFFPDLADFIRFIPNAFSIGELSDNACFFESGIFFFLFFSTSYSIPLPPHTAVRTHRPGRSGFEANEFHLKHLSLGIDFEDRPAVGGQQTVGMSGELALANSRLMPSKERIGFWKPVNSARQDEVERCHFVLESLNESFETWAPVKRNVPIKR